MAPQRVCVCVRGGAGRSLAWRVLLTRPLTRQRYGSVANARAACKMDTQGEHRVSTELSTHERMPPAPAPSAPLTLATKGAHTRKGAYGERRVMKEGLSNM